MVERTDEGVGELAVREIDAIRAFWNANPCDARDSLAPFGTPEFFREHAAYRYRAQWHLEELVPFSDFAGRDVLEIGCGLGADGARFAAAGARYTGVDLTSAAVDATRLRFASLGLPGTFRVSNAESLDEIDSESFDLVYSQGVLHHTPDITRALGQVRRVLRPGGQIILMLYHRHSFNYYVRILGYLRLRIALYALGRRLGRQPGSLEPHFQNIQRMGSRYFSAAELVNHCADGPNCPLARAYTRTEVRRMLGPGFSDLHFKVAHFPIRKSAPRFPLPVERVLARSLGWYLFVYGKKV